MVSIITDEMGMQVRWVQNAETPLLKAAVLHAAEQQVTFYKSFTKIKAIWFLQQRFSNSMKWHSLSPNYTKFSALS